MKHGKMDNYQRAKQFMPFAALKGYKEALKEKEKQVVFQASILEDTLEELDYTLASLHPGDMVSCIYYDEEEYVKLTGMLAHVNYDFHTITIVDKTIPAKYIKHLEVIAHGTRRNL
ncbi:YolD-like family protein [Sharpea azabuensis]|uniref:YolD-like family protein n=1 Tax=Sharpea porci TaxID=2652286 RepID=A0A844FVL6_9FIRM|nr:YolD-like family protein [Sharpea porci]MST89655.1 YolD-like family protein [Sharpea porci]